MSAVLQYFSEPTSLPINPAWFKVAGVDKSRLEKITTPEFQKLKLGVPLALDDDGYIKFLETTDSVYQGFLFSDAAASYLYPNSAIASGLVPVVTGGGLLDLDANYFFGAAVGAIVAGAPLFIGSTTIFQLTETEGVAPIGVTVGKRVASEATVRVRLFESRYLPVAVNS
jgi:hypothetical protein